MSNILHDAGMIGSGVTASASVMVWFDAHASGISAIILILTFILTMVFHVLNYRLKSKYMETDRRKKDDNS